MKQNLNIKLVTLKPDFFGDLKLRITTVDYLIDQELKANKIELANRDDVPRFEYIVKHDEHDINMQVEIPYVYYRDSHPTDFASTLTDFDLLVLDLQRPLSNFRASDIKEIIIYIRQVAPVIPLVFIFQNKVHTCFQQQVEIVARLNSAFIVYTTSPKYIAVINQSIPLCNNPTLHLNNFNNNYKNQLSLFAQVFYKPSTRISSIIKKTQLDNEYKQVAKDINWIDNSGKLTALGQELISSEEIYLLYKKNRNGLFQCQVKSAGKNLDSINTCQKN